MPDPREAPIHHLRRFLASLALVSLMALPGCTALQQLAVLRTVTFAFAGVSDVRVAGIRVGPGSNYASLSVADVTRLGAALLAKEVPLEMITHVSATNPSDNTVAARMVDLDWTLFIEDRRMLAGGLGGPIAISPGRTVDVPLAVRFDLLQLGGGRARDLFDLALAIAGQGSVQKELRIELVPTIETSLGPMRYPTPVIVRRTAR
jgi:hypothetical protein